MADLVRRAQPGDVVLWGVHRWRVRGLVLAPGPTVTLGLIGRRDSLRVDPRLWAKATWQEPPGRWVLPDEQPGPAV